MTGVNKKQNAKDEPNPPGSKNGPSGKGNDPDADRPGYVEGRGSGSRNYVERTGKVAGFVRNALGLPEGGRDGRASAAPAAVLKSGEGPFRRGTARRFARRPGDPERRGLGRPRGKPRRRPRVPRTGDATPRETIGRMAGDAAARGADTAGSAGFRRIRVPEPAQRRVRRDQREAVGKTARRAPHMARRAPRRPRRAGQKARRASGRRRMRRRAGTATRRPTPDAAESKTAWRYGTADAAA